MNGTLPARLFGLTVGLGLLAVVSGKLAVSADADAKRIIHVNQLQRSTVIGRLGIPLGNVVTLEGRVAPDLSRNKGRDGRLVLSIEAVDGNVLDQSIEFWDEIVVLPKGAMLEVGRRFRFAAYETGSFQGIPRGSTDRVAAGRSFGYVPKLAIERDLTHEQRKQ